MTRSRGSLIIVTGFPATGTGKTTIIGEALLRLKNAARVVTCTTRDRRGNEVDGRDYHFLSKETFQAKLDAGDFLEHDQHYEHWYGTRRSDVERMLAMHDAVILITDLTGAKTLTQIYPDACFIAIKASTEEVSKFMVNRGDPSEKIAKRLTKTQLAKEKKVFTSIKFTSVIENRSGALSEVVKQFVDHIELYQSSR